MPSNEKSRTEKERTEHRKLNPFGTCIRAAREKCGLSLAEAGKLLHCTKGYVYQLETRDTMNPSVDTLANIAAVYRLDLEEVTRLAAECAPDAAYRMTLVPPGRKRK
jgi:transcriptional regulator with XRE-family HTH domain